VSQKLITFCYIFITFIKCVLIVTLTGCSSISIYERTVNVAKRSYYLGCVDKSGGQKIERLQCYCDMVKFEKEVRSGK
jgi:hypothetical protein